MVGHCKERRRKFRELNKRDRGHRGHRGHRGREYAGQDYCSVEWDGDVRWERYCLSALEIWASRERFSLCEMAEGARGRRSLGDDERCERSERSALWRAG